MHSYLSATFLHNYLCKCCLHLSVEWKIKESINFSPSKSSMFYDRVVDTSLPKCLVICFYNSVKLLIVSVFISTINYLIYIYNLSRNNKKDDTNLSTLSDRFFYRALALQKNQTHKSLSFNSFSSLSFLLSFRVLFLSLSLTKFTIFFFYL